MTADPHMWSDSAAMSAAFAPPSFGLAALAANWGWLLLRGVLALLLAAVALLFPLGAIVAFTLVFAAWSAVDGLFSLVAGVRGVVSKADRWGALIVRGILGIGVAALIAFLPSAGVMGYAIVTLLIVGVWAMLTGAFEIAAAIRLRKAVGGEWMLALLGLVSILLGAAILWVIFTDPLATLVSAAWLIGVYALISGVVLVGLALRLRGIHRATASPDR